jgi:hypothetical protein
MYNIVLSLLIHLAGSTLLEGKQDDSAKYIKRQAVAGLGQSCAAIPCGPELSCNNQSLYCIENGMENQICGASYFGRSCITGLTCQTFQNGISMCRNPNQPKPTTTNEESPATSLFIQPVKGIPTQSPLPTNSAYGSVPHHLLFVLFLLLN